MSAEAQAETITARILAVDDDPISLDALRIILQPQFEVVAAPSGEHALLIAAHFPKPDLILLDVLMPKMDGYAVLTRLRDNPDTHDIPVIFVTSLDAAEDEMKGLELGVVDYITKPYHPSIILARVQSQLELKRARDRLANQNTYLEIELARRLKEIQQAEMQLLQTEKMAAIGQLAAGIVHEINNPVSYVMNNLDSLDVYQRDIFELLAAYEALEGACPSNNVAFSKIQELKGQKELDFLRKDIGQLIAESKQGLLRVGKIVHDLKNFSHAESDKDWQWADLHAGLEATLNIVWNEIKYSCTLIKCYGDIPLVYCLPSQINQVLLNLLVNAAQATPKKGEITLRTGQVCDEVFIAISDTGTGIPTENLPRLFEPFFTTKPVGKGTGLGLSVSYGIVQKHKGRIDVESTEGKGTTFTVWLPINQSPAATTERS